LPNKSLETNLNEKRRGGTTQGGGKTQSRALNTKHKGNLVRKKFPGKRHRPENKNGGHP